MFFLSPDSCLCWSGLKWNRLLPAISSLHGYCYQSEMGKKNYTHTHTVIKMRERWERKAWWGRWEREDGRVRGDFSATGMINISLFFILLEWLRNNFLLALTQTGIKPSLSPASFLPSNRGGVCETLTMTSSDIFNSTVCLCENALTVISTLCVVTVYYTQAQRSLTGSQKVIPLQSFLSSGQVFSHLL